MTTGEHILQFMKTYGLHQGEALEQNTTELYKKYLTYCEAEKAQPINNKSFITFIKIMTDSETISKRVWNKETKKYEHVNILKN